MSISNETPSRREVLVGAAAVGTMTLASALPAIAEENGMKKTFTILHTNDLHSNLIGMAPSRTTCRSRSVTQPAAAMRDRPR